MTTATTMRAVSQDRLGGGAYVTGTASAPKHELLRQLGADELIDYRTVDFRQATDQIDVVVDLVGGDYAARSLEVLRPGGVLVSLAAATTQPMPERAAQRGVRHRLMLVEADQAGMLAVADLVRAGSLRPVIEATFPLEQAAEAHTLGDTGHVTGKIVLTAR